jgi:hypothetical protein
MKWKRYNFVEAHRTKYAVTKQCSIVTCQRIPKFRVGSTSKVVSLANGGSVCGGRKHGELPARMCFKAFKILKALCSEQVSL